MHISLIDKEEKSILVEVFGGQDLIIKVTTVTFEPGKPGYLIILVSGWENDGKFTLKKGEH